MPGSWESAIRDRCWDNVLVLLYVREGAGGEGGIQLKALAAELGLSHRGAKSLLDLLERALLVRMDSRAYVSPTPIGRQVAAAIVRRHRVVECFLAGALGLPTEACHEEAERLQRSISSLVEDKMFEFLGKPTRCPHGEAIPHLSTAPSTGDGALFSTMERGSAEAVSRAEPGRTDYEYREPPAWVRHAGRREAALADRSSIDAMQAL